MKKLLKVFLGICFLAFFCYSFAYGMEREQRRQCIVAMDTCEKYADVGACEPEYLKVCEGVENVD